MPFHASKQFLSHCNYAYDFCSRMSRGKKRNPYPSVTAYVQVRSWNVYTGEIAVDGGWFLREENSLVPSRMITQLAVWE